jgi:hypothetical protein
VRLFGDRALVCDDRLTFRHHWSIRLSQEAKQQFALHDRIHLSMQTNRSSNVPIRVIWRIKTPNHDARLHSQASSG